MADRQMTAEELLKHPEYAHTVWPLEPEQKGTVSVAHGRGGPLDIAYEVHGHGDLHLVVGRAPSIFSHASQNGTTHSNNLSWLQPGRALSYTARQQHKVHQ